MKILLAVDDSEFSDAAVQAVIQQMRPESTEVCVLHVARPLPLVVYPYVGQTGEIKALEQEGWNWDRNSWDTRNNS
jgi:Universal stress protein family